MDYSDDLVATLPRDEAELMARSENLSADARGRFAARLALAHKDNLATEVLVRRLLHTQPLSDEIQVQTDPLVSTGSADDWDVVAKVATKKMTIVQTNACKKLHQRVVGIQMAVALRNEQLLNEIIAHPSQTMKEKAKSTLAEIRAEMNPRTVVEPDHTANFILYFDAIRDAPMQVITGDSARTRNQVWEEFANAKWNLFWTNGSLKSITDRVLRTKAAEILLQLLKTVPPFNSIQVKTEFVHVPYLPVLIRKNLKLLLKMDVTETVTAVCSVLSDRTVNIESDLLSPLLSRKHNVWSDLSKSSKLASMVDKVLVATRGAKPKDDRNTASTLFNKRILDVFLGARPVRSILLHLLQDAQQSNTLLLTVYTAAIASEKNDLARFKLTENFLKDLRTALEYIFAILSNLLKRILATGTMETKHESQLIFEADVKGTLDVVLNIFEDAFAVLPTTEGVQLKFTNKKKSHKWSMLLSPLFTILQEHPQLAMYLFLAVKDEFSETDTSGASLVLNCLKSKSLSVFDYPGNTTEAPYSGINRFGPHNHEAFVLFMKLYPVLDKWQFWSNAVATECLSVDQIGLLKNHFTIEFLGQQSCYVITTILDQLIVDAVERGAMALQLIAFVKKRELPAIQIKYIIDQLYERLDVCVVESRTLLEENLRQPSIDSRVDAIRQFLKATNMSHSIGETILTLSCIFQRVKNEMRLNMDQIFFQISCLLQDTWYAEYTVEEANLLSTIYEALDKANLAAVSTSPPLTNFIEKISNHMIAHYISSPAHPFFQLAIEVLWRHSVHQSGHHPSIMVSLPLCNPEYSKKNTDLEMLKRKSLNKGIQLEQEIQRSSLLYKLANPFGLFLITEGQEETVVSQIVALMMEHYKRVVDDPNVDFHSTKCGVALFHDLVGALQLRWSRSSTLLLYFERCFSILEKAPRVSNMDEVILDWTREPESTALAFVRLCCDRAPLSFETRLTGLILVSTQAVNEASRLYSLCKEVSEKDSLVLRLCALSQSALHLPFVMAHVLRNRPHLLKEQHIAEKTAFLGVFNTSKSARLHFVLDNTAEVKPLPGDLLLHWQADLLLKRYWQEAFDKKLPLGERVMAASRLVNMANVSVNEIASFLVEDSLPSRVKEGVLMFLPLIDEPAAAIDLLTAPVFLQSDLARTAIYAVKNVLPYMEKDVLVEVLKGLVPAPGAKIKVGVFKEITRLLADYCHIPEVLTMLEELWYRDYLHSDVRISLLQKSLTLLDHSNKKITDTAWSIVLDCVHGKWMEGAGMVLVLVQLESGTLPSYPALITVPSVHTHYTFGDLSTGVVKKEIVSSYTSDVMVPLALRLFDVVKKLSKSKENYNDLNNRMKHVFGNIANGGFISKENAAHISWTMKDLYSESYMSLPENLASSLFEILTTIMAKCACEMANTSFNAPIPEAWINISSCSQTLAKILLSPISDPQARMTAKSKLAKLNLKTLLIFNSEIKSKAIRHAQMMPVEATWAIPGAKMYFSDLHFDRQLAIFKNEVDLVHHHSQLLQERKDNLLHIAESLISTLVANGFKVSSYGYLELSKAEFKSRLNILFMETNKLSVFNEFIIEIYDSNTWLSDLEGFENFKNDFRLLLLESPQLEMNSPARLASLINAVFVDELASSRMQDDLAQCCLKLLRDFHNSFSALQRWNELGPNSSRSPIAPKHDDNGLNCILSLLSKLEETLEPSNQESSIFKFLQSVFTGCPSFLLLKSPASITHFILHHNCSKLEDAWISYLSSALAIKDTAILEHPISGTQGVASILQKIFIKAKSKQFEVKEPETARFTSIFCCHLRLVLYLCPSAVEYLSDFPTSPCGKKLVEEILQQYGPVTACSFLEAVFEGKVTEVDIGSFMSNDVPSFTHSVPFFNLIADKKGEDVLLITSQNSHRKNLGSVQGVMDEFQKVKKHPALDKYLHRKAISSASAIVDIHTPPASNDVVFFVLSRFKLEMALTNPILYLRVATSALQIAKIQPFQYPTLNLLDITVLANSIKDKKDSFNATPLQYLIDLARLLSESIAPQFDAVKSFRIASTVRRIALETLKSVHSVTVECCFAKGSKTMASVVDLLVFEAAVNGKLAGEMLIPGFWEAIQNLMFSGDRKVFDGCLELQSSSWQLKWAEHELKEKKVDK